MHSAWRAAGLHSRVMYQTAQPAAALRSVVRFYAGADIHAPAQPIRLPVPARTFPAIDFTFGDPFRIRLHGDERRETAPAVGVIGAKTCAGACLEMHGRLETFVIVFQPSGLFSLFSIPGAELTDRYFEGVSVLGRFVDELRCELGDARSFDERVVVAERYLLHRWRFREPRGGAGPAAVELLLRQGGARVADLAAYAGWSVRQLERRFIHEIGMPPKLFARVARFEGVLRHRMRYPGLRWTDIAQELGYHDQSHMLHDFREFSAAAPSDAVPGLDLFLDRAFGVSAGRAGAAVSRTDRRPAASG